jgi:hypothetical protein
MCPDLWTIFDFFGWLRTNEQSIAIWLEGIALVAIFFLELKEYRRQGRDKKEQRDEWVKQMAIMQSQADAAKANAEAAKLGAQAVLNSERAWIEIILGPATQPDYQDDAQSVSSGLFECSIQIENKGKTIAYIESVQVGADTTTGTIPEEPVKSFTQSFRSLLGSGQKQTVRQFNADSGFSDGQDIVNGTSIGILRVIVKYRDIVDASILHQTSAVYLFKKSLENEPERISTLSDYK